LRFIFTDSIILISDDDSPDSALKTLIYAWQATQSLLVQQLPVRGGIALGEMYANPSTNVFVGTALTKAYALEQRQEWIGVALDASIGEYIDSLADVAPVLDQLFLRYNVPMKGDTTESLRTLNWRMQFKAEDGTSKLFQRSGDPKIDIKIDNALSYARSVVASGKVHLKSPPTELRGLAIGTKPTTDFVHGDDF
jgi:hypothetical protein